MDNDATKKYREVKELFNRMSHEICAVVESYHIWRTLTFARSIPEVGKEQAEKNAELMGIYKDFFIPTEQSHLQTFVVGLMKFFDKNSQALSFAALIRELNKNKNVFTADIVREVHPALANTDAIKDDYTPITQETIDEIENLRKPHEALIADLKDVRDKQFAHTDMEAIKGTFVPFKVEALIEAVQKIYNKLTSDFDLSGTVWTHLKDDSIRSTRYMLESLEKGENMRKEEIKRKYGS